MSASRCVFSCDEQRGLKCAAPAAAVCLCQIPASWGDRQYVDFELVEPNSVLATLRRLDRVMDFCRVFSAHDCGIGGSIPSTVSALGLLRSALLP